MLKHLLSTILATSLAVIVNAADTKITLTENGQSGYVIVEQPNAIPAEKTACKELQRYLKQISGVELPIVAPNHPAKKRILVGQSTEITELTSIDPIKLKNDEIIVRTVGDTLILTGQRPRGTLYAVDTFLEDTLGVRWWTSYEEHVPSIKNITIPPLDIRYAPSFMIRESFYCDVIHGNPEFAVHLKNNGYWRKIPPELGGHIEVLGFCHTFNQLLPPTEYFKTHPEWYAQIDGKRIADGQLCLTNVAMREELIKRAEQWLRDHPDQKVISISQNDGRFSCTCPACAAEVKREGSESGPLIRLVNEVAAELEKKFPDVQVETLAYMYTVDVPKRVRPRHNVIVRLCVMAANLARPLNSNANAPFRKSIEAWSRICRKLAIWNYIGDLNNYLIPYPNLNGMGKDLKYFAANHVISVFEQGDVGSDGVGDLLQLRTWLNAKLLWNPQLDQQTLTDDFLKGYYGPAAPYIRQYIDLLEKEVAKPGMYLGMQNFDTNGWLSLSATLKSMALMEQAIAAVKNDQVLCWRVRRTALSSKFGLLTRVEASRWNHDPASQSMLKNIDLEALMNKTIAEAKEFHVRQGQEGLPFSVIEEKIRTTIGKPVPVIVPDFCKKLPPQDWLEIPNEIFNPIYLGGWSFHESDPNATYKTAIRMATKESEWCIQNSLATAAGIHSKWKIYLAARCETETPQVNAFSCGVYDNSAKIEHGIRMVPAKEILGKSYRYLEIGTYKLTPTCIFWIQPVRNENMRIYLDRMILVKVK